MNKVKFLNQATQLSSRYYGIKSSIAHIIYAWVNDRDSILLTIGHEMERSRYE